jgi:putative transcriptional regulator
LATLILLALLPAGSTGEEPAPEAPAARGYLTGRLLVAHPDMTDPRFRRTVIFMVRHDENGAFGLVVNKVVGRVEFTVLLEDMGSDPEGIEGDVQVRWGGPVQPSSATVLHSGDLATPPGTVVNDRYGVTINAEILEAMASGKGPKHTLLVMGHAGWAQGQLERELEIGGWVVAPADETIVFDDDDETKWERAFENRYLNL